MKVEDIADPVEGIIFDMDGLLVNSEKLYWDANIVAAKEANLDIPDDSYLKLVGSSVKEMEDFYHKHFKTEADRDKFIKRTDDLVWKWTDEGKLKLQPGVREALAVFKEKNIKLSIASSNYENVIVHNLDVLKIKDYFAGEKSADEPTPAVFFKHVGFRNDVDDIPDLQGHQKHEQAQDDVPDR